MSGSTFERVVAVMMHGYDALAKLPFEYCRAKFSRTIFVIAEKLEDRDVLDGLPKAYAPSLDWENISQA
jgi:hypothetical protein